VSRLDELIHAQKEMVGLAKGGHPYRPNSTGSDSAPVEKRLKLQYPQERHPTLAEAGIDKKLSSRPQELAAVPESIMNRK
jgi:hypothetical protein